MVWYDSEMDVLNREPRAAPDGLPGSRLEFDPSCPYYAACREHSKTKPRLTSCKQCKETRLRSRIAVPPELACHHCGFCRFPQPVCVFLDRPGTVRWGVVQ